MEIVNRVARHDYFIEEEYECGIVLTGTEIKSIRDGKANIKDSYGIVRNGEIFLLNMFISHYKEGNIFNHDETRTRKLLMHKAEIRKLGVKNRAKVLLGLCKGKKDYDKRESIKERDIKRQLSKASKNVY